MTNILIVCAYVLLVALSAFFSSCEIAFAKSNKQRIKKAAEAGDKIAGKANYINDHYVQSLSTVLVGNNLVNIAASSAATVFCVSVFAKNGQTIATVATTVILLIFGETVPKIVAADIPDQLSRLYAPLLRLFMVIFKPVVLSVSKLVEKLSPLWTPKEAQPQVTQEELYEILEDAEEEGVFTEEEGELIKSAIEITDIMAMEILTPRVDMLALDVEDFQDIDEDLSSEMLRHSRIPVYRDTIDNIIGILPTKQWMKARLTEENVDIESLLVPPIFVHKTRMISSIIREFRREHLQMAVVVDEFGGTMGILTMEDIMEEIVGEIFDERDDVEDEIVKVADDTYIVDGAMNVYDLFDMVEFEPRDFETEYTTVGGWATEMLDRFPKAGDEFVYERLTVRVLEAQPTRVEQLRVTVAPPPEEDEE